MHDDSAVMQQSSQLAGHGHIRAGMSSLFHHNLSHPYPNINVQQQQNGDWSLF